MMQQALDIVIKMVEQNKRDVDKKLDTIDAKLDQLIQFKWQIVGGSVVISVLVTLAIQLGSFFLKHG